MNAGFLGRLGNIFRERANGLAIAIANKTILFLANNGNVGFNTLFPNYKFDLSQDGNSSQFRIGVSGADDGGFLLAFLANQLYISSGGRYDGTNWIAKASSAAIFGVLGNGFAWYTNTGLTAGSSFSTIQIAGIDSSGNLSLKLTGSSYRVKEGSNACMGTAVLSNGSVVVSTTAVTANSRIFLTAQTASGSTGWLNVSNVTAGTSFTITSSAGTDGNTVAWIIFEPA